MGINEPPWHTARLGWHRAVNHVVQSKLMSKLPYAGGWAALSFASATRKYIPSSLGGVASRSVAPTATERFSAGGSAVLGSSLFFRNVPARVPQEVNRAQHWIASTNQSQHSHSTAQSQRSHSAVTAHSQHSHSTVTAQSWSPGAAQPQHNHGHSHSTATAQPQPQPRPQPRHSYLLGRPTTPTHPPTVRVTCPGGPRRNCSFQTQHGGPPGGERACSRHVYNMYDIRP